MERGLEHPTDPITTCESCGHHFQVDPRGDVQEGCPDCGSNRMWMNQPSPTQSDGTLRDMVDSDTQKDQGGNPLAEGTIMGGEGEKPLDRRDNYMHGHVKKAVAQKPCADCGLDAMVLSDGTVYCPNCKQTTPPAERVQPFDIHQNPTWRTSPTLEPEHGPNLLQRIFSSLEERPDLFGEGDPIDALLNGQGDELDDERFYDHMDAYYQRQKEELARKHEQYMQGQHEQHAPPQMDPTHPDPWMDNEPGTLTFPQHWAGKEREGMKEFERHTRSMEPYESLWEHVAQEEQPEQPDEQQQAPAAPTGGLGGGIPVPGVGGLMQGVMGGGEAAGGAAGGAAGAAGLGELAELAPLALLAATEHEAFSPEEQLALQRGPQMGEEEMFNSQNSKSQYGEAVPGWERRRTPREQDPAATICPACKSGQIVGPACNQCGTTVDDILGGRTREPLTDPGDAFFVPAPEERPSPLAAFMGHYETPASNPDVGTKHDDPEEVDQKEFNDQDHSPKNLNNPETGEPGGATSGEPGHEKQDMDNFADGSPAVETLTQLLPLLLHFFNSGESGANHPAIKGLHEMLESEHPGYLDKGDPHHAEILIQTMQPKHAVVENAGMTGEAPEMIPQAEPQIPSQVMPTAQQPPGGTVQGGHCPSCGGALDPGTGGCPMCGQKQQATQQAQQTMVPGSAFAQQQVMANHQGPTTPEQIAVVQQWLIEHGRQGEVPNVPLDPGNPEYVKILSDIQGRANVAPQVSPQEATPPPPPAPPGGTMPVPGMGGGAPEGAPMQPMASVDDGSLLFAAVLAADNVADRCPVCESGTTGMVGDDKNTQHCHSCGHKWVKEDVENDNAVGTSSFAHVAAPVVNNPNPVDAPAAEQASPLDIQPNEDSGLTWKDDSGEPLKAGGTYMMKSTQYPVPDMVKIMRVKPDGLEVNIIGTFENEPSALHTTEHITREEMQSNALTFSPAPQDADDRNAEPPQGGQAPGLPPQQETTDERANAYPAFNSSVKSDQCTKCGHVDGEVTNKGHRIGHSSTMIAADASEYECGKCGNHWIAKEEVVGLQRDGEDWVNPAAEWIRDDDDSWSDTDRQRMMTASRSSQSRSIHDIPRDRHAQEVKDYLDTQPSIVKEGGRYFSPLEQRTLIDEDGVARNSDLLNLEGTHYKSSTEENQLDPDRVPFEHILFGM